MSEVESVSQDGMFGTGQYTDSALQMRLDPSKLIENLEAWLRGERIQYDYDPQSNETKVRVIKVADPLMNKQGIHSFMSHINALVNPGTVQGYFENVKSYNFHLAHLQKDIACILVINSHKWGITDVGTMESIMAFYMQIAISYLSRGIENKERESYMQTMRMTEHHTQTKGKRFGFGSSNE